MKYNIISTSLEYLIRHIICEVMLKLYVCLVFLISTGNRETFGIHVSNGRYEDVHIIIKDSNADSQELLDAIKEVFTNASALMFTATRHQLYFGTIKIIVPKAWSKKSWYKQMPVRLFHKSHIIIEKGGKSTQPQVRGLHECGKGASYMQSPPEFFLSRDKNQKQEEVIVHEWGHLRWGLFDEYPINTDVRFYQAHGKWEAVRCSASVKGVIRNFASDHECNPKVTSTEMHKDCTFYPQQSKHGASLMYYQNLKLSMFCDKEGPDVAKELHHNTLAPNRQNKMCEHKSAWEVMREHDDFKESQSQPASTNTVPEFEFIQESTSYRVFVFDTSNSMKGDRIKYLYQTAEYIIQNVIPEGSWLGIVKFGTTAKILERPRQVFSQTDRDILKDGVPKAAELEATCIGCGIVSAVNVLKESMGNPANGEIIILSDGENNEGDLDLSTLESVKAQVVIHTIAIEQGSDVRLSEIARKTGGRHYTYMDEGGISLKTTFSELIVYGSSPSSNQASVMLLSERMNSSTPEINLEFPIERGLGKNTAVAVMSQSESALVLQLKGPNGYQKQVVADGYMTDITMPGIAEAGDYEITITTDGSNQMIECIVMTSPVDDDNDIIRVSAMVSPQDFDSSSGKLPIIYADVTKGYMPLLNATVKAFIDANGSTCETFLADNGIESDSFVEDGVYTGYISPECLRLGRVNIKVYAGGRSGETKIGSSLTASSIPNSAEEHDEIYYESFQRVKILEDMNVSHYEDPKKQDVVPPGRISDVGIHHIVTEDTLQGERRNVTITWTATGDDKSFGIASEYMLRISTDFATLLNKFDSADILDMNIRLAPKEAGEMEALKIVIEAEQKYISTAYFAVRAIDEAGNVGDVSNIVSIVVAKEFIVYDENGTIIGNDDDDHSRSSAYFANVMLIALCILILKYK